MTNDDSWCHARRAPLAKRGAKPLTFLRDHGAVVHVEHHAYQHVEQLPNSCRTAAEQLQCEGPRAASWCGALNHINSPHPLIAPAIPRFGVIFGVSSVFWRIGSMMTTD